MEKENPLPGQVLAKIDFVDYGADVVVASGDDANVITSRVEPRAETWYQERHKPVLDIDIEAKLIPSSTPGHYHLIIDREMTWETYQDLLMALARAGIVEDSYVNASVARGFSAVRLPWITKEKKRS